MGDHVRTNVVDLREQLTVRVAQFVDKEIVDGLQQRRDEREGEWPIVRTGRSRNGRKTSRMSISCSMVTAFAVASWISLTMISSIS